MPAVVAVLAVIEGADLPEDVLALLDRPLALSGTYGDSEAGDPIQYDELRIEHDQGVVEIVVYNRAVLLFFTDSEPVRRIRVALSDVHGSRRGSSRAPFSAPRRHRACRAARRSCGRVSPCCACPVRRWASLHAGSPGSTLLRRGREDRWRLHLRPSSVRQRGRVLLGDRDATRAATPCRPRP